MKYERLTKRLPNGGVKIESKTQWAVLYHEKYTGYDMEAKMRLAELEDKIEAGTLIELPCKVGDTVYKVYGLCDGDTKCPYGGGYGYWRCNYKDERRCKPFVEEISFEIVLLNEIGKTIFVTKAEAEARLKELRGEV